MDKVKAIIERFKLFLAGSKVELKKVTWPTPKQTLASTSVVIIVVLIVSTFFRDSRFWPDKDRQACAGIIQWLLGGTLYIHIPVLKTG